MPRRGSAARRYAEAAFQLAERDGALDRWGDDLRRAAEIASDEQIARIVGSPMVPLTERQDLVERLLARRLAKPAMNLVRILVQRGNLELVPAIAAEYQRLLNRQRGIVEALVTSATPLTPDEDRAIRDRVAQLTGTTVDVQTAVDPELIGGLTVRIGDRLIDASVRGRLARLREQLLAGARVGG
jgi:F-type H+-transporting ATPase subunit delta